VEGLDTPPVRFRVKKMVVCEKLRLSQMTNREVRSIRGMKRLETARKLPIFTDVSVVEIG